MHAQRGHPTLPVAPVLAHVADRFDDLVTDRLGTAIDPAVEIPDRRAVQEDVQHHDQRIGEPDPAQCIPGLPEDVDPARTGLGIEHVGHLVVDEVLRQPHQQQQDVERAHRHVQGAMRQGATAEDGPAATDQGDEGDDGDLPGLDEDRAGHPRHHEELVAILVPWQELQLVVPEQRVGQRADTDGRHRPDEKGDDDDEGRVYAVARRLALPKADRCRS